MTTKRMTLVADTDDRAPQRADFIKALEWRMQERGMSWRELSDLLGRGAHTAFYRWRELKAEPRPSEAFKIEALLEMPPGALSRYLGYLPPEARSEATAKMTFEEYLKYDVELNDLARQVLRSVYADFTRKTKSTRKRTGPAGEN